MKTCTMMIAVMYMGIVSFMSTVYAADSPFQQVNTTGFTERNVKMATIQVPFIRNQGQIDAQVAFYARMFGGTAFVTTTGELIYDLPQRNADGTTVGIALREILVGGHVQHVYGTDETATQVSTFKGNDPSKWQRNLCTYETVNLGEVYDGVSMSLKAYGHNVEKLFMVQPGAAPETIRLKIDGAQGMMVNSAGELEVTTPGGVVQFTKPVAYQERDGVRHAVEVAYRINHEGYGFHVGQYDHSQVLVLDPLLASTFVGGSAQDYASAMALGPYGDVYVTGYTYSTDFPTTIGAYATSHSGASPDVFVVKLTPTLSSLSAATYIGGNDSDKACALAVDINGIVYVTGMTWSANFPVTPGAYNPIPEEQDNLFILRLTSSLSSLTSSTFFGGPCAEAYALAVTSSSHVYLAGAEYCALLPTTSGAYDQTNNGSRDAFVAEFDWSLSTLVASTYIGGTFTDEALALAFDGYGNVYITGHTNSSDFPTTPDVYDRSYNSTYVKDAFVARFNSALSSLLSSTFLGGSEDEEGRAIAVTGSGNVYVTGYTESPNFPTTTGAFDSSHNLYEDVFVTWLSFGLTSLVGSTFLGGTASDYGRAIALDNSGNVYVAGATDSSDFPVTTGAYDTDFGGTADVNDAFITKLNSTFSTLIASTYLGGSGDDSAKDLLVDGSGTIYVAGETVDSSFPTTPGAYDTSYNGSSDVFVTRFSDLAFSSNSYLLWTK